MGGICALNQISGNESLHGNCWFHQRCQPACNDCVIRTWLNLYLTPVPTHIHTQLHERVTTVLTSMRSREEQTLKILKQIQRKAVGSSLLWMVVNPNGHLGGSMITYALMIQIYDAAFCPIKVHSHNIINWFIMQKATLLQTTQYSAFGIL